MTTTTIAVDNPADDPTMPDGESTALIAVDRLLDGLIDLVESETITLERFARITGLDLSDAREMIRQR
jgi:hypothetical protein